MAITICTVSGNVQNLLGNGVQSCTINVTVPTPFFHSGTTWISGELGSVSTDSSGNFSIGVIETTTPGQRVTFTFNYFDGVAGRRNKSYAVVVPNQATANLSDLIASTNVPAISPLTVQYGGTGATTLTAHGVLLGEGTAAVATAAPGTAGYPLASNGASADPSFQQLNLAGAGVTGVLPNANTTATAANTAAAIMARDGSGQVAATTFTGALVGNASTVTTNANLTGPIASIGNATSVTAQTGTGTTFVMQASPTLTTPNLGTPSTLVGTNISGTAASLTAGNVTTNANMTGDVTSVGNATTYNNAVPAGKGGTGATASSATPAASANVLWDANSNLSGNNILDGFATTATAAGTTTLAVGSAGQQYFTGSTTQTVKLPVASTLALGMQFLITNQSSGIVTVQSSGANTLQAMAANTQILCTVILTSGTGTASWNWVYQAIQNTLAGGGTVSSVTFTGDGTVLSSTPSAAVTTSGTVTAALATAAAQTYLGGPTSGAAAAPTYRTFTAPSVQKFPSTGAQVGWLFTISTSTTCAVGDTYTNNAHTYTVQIALSAQSGTVLFMSGTGATSGTTLTRSAGSGTASITFSTTIATALYTAPTAPAPLYQRLTMVGGGAGGGGAGGSPTTGGAGGSTYFGLDAANGAAGGTAAGVGGAGGSASLSLVKGVGVSGGIGGATTGTAAGAGGGYGAPSALGGGATGGTSTIQSGQTAAANSGSGGGGAFLAAATGAGGGGAGAYVQGVITAVATTTPYVVGAAGSSGTGTNGGGAGGAGILIVEEFYQ